MKSVLRVVAIVVNVGVSIWLLTLLIDDPGDSAMIPAGLILLAILNTYLLIFSDKPSKWLSLYLDRKALEEKRKIAELNKDIPTS